jgi:hypothetical protein
MLYLDLYNHLHSRPGDNSVQSACFCRSFGILGGRGFGSPTTDFVFVLPLPLPFVFSVRFLTKSMMHRNVELLYFFPYPLFLLAMS